MNTPSGPPGAIVTRPHRLPKTKTWVLIFVALYSIAAIPALAGSGLDQRLADLAAIPLFLYNEDFTTVSTKHEQFNNFSFTKLASVVFAMFVVGYVARKRPRLKLATIDVPFVSLMVYRIASEFIFGREINLSLPGYIVIALALYAMINEHFEKGYERSIYVVVVGIGIANAVVIIWQAYAIQRTVGEFVLRDFSNQPRGMLMDAVVASIYLAVCLIMLLENMWPLGFAAKSACSLMLLVGAVLTGSRGFLAMLMVYFAVRAKKVLSSWRRVALALGAVLVVGVAGLLAWGDALSTMFDNFQTLANYQEDPSSMSRKDKLRSAMDMFVENPVFGIGSNNFHAETDSEVPTDETLATNPHNVYAQVLAENGLLGGLLVAWMAVLLWVNRRKVDPALRIAMMALCLGMGYIGALNSLPLVVMFVGFLCCFRNAICSESQSQS